MKERGNKLARSRGRHLSPLPQLCPVQLRILLFLCVWSHVPKLSCQCPLFFMQTLHTKYLSLFCCLAFQKSQYSFSLLRPSAFFEFLWKFSNMPLFELMFHLSLELSLQEKYRSEVAQPTSLTFSSPAVKCQEVQTNIKNIRCCTSPKLGSYICTYDVST